MGRHAYRIQRKCLQAPERSKAFVPLFSNIVANCDHGIAQAANRIVMGNYHFLGVEIKSEPMPKWHKDYMSDYEWPLLPYHRIRRVTPDRAEIKNPWELSSFFHLFPVAVAFRQTGNAGYRKFVEDQIAEWKESNPCPFGVNWCNPMSVALRAILVVEIVCALEGADGENHSINGMDSFLWEHLLFLANHLENLGAFPGNHYVADLAGLLWSGLYFSQKNKVVRYIRRMAIRRLETEIRRQVQDDGMNYEGSLGYHRLVTELFLYSCILTGKNNIEMSISFTDRLASMLQVLHDFTLPDGNQPLIGDNDDCRLFWGQDYFTDKRLNAGYLLHVGAAFFNKAQWRQENAEARQIGDWIFGLDRSSRRSDESASFVGENKSVSLKSSQFFISKKDRDCLVVNCNHPGKPGSGHSHNDTLSFLLCFDGTEIFTDPGTYVYTRDLAMRNLFRSTGFHNVVCVNDEEQWPIPETFPFFLPKKIAPRVLVCKSNGEEDFFEGEHYGYLRLPEKIVHRRSYRYKKKRGELFIRDRIFSASEDGGNGKRARLGTFFHVSRNVLIERHNGTCFLFRRKDDGGELCRLTWPGTVPTGVEVRKTWTSDRYGCKQETEMIVFETERFLPCTFEYKIEKSHASFPAIRDNSG